MTFDISDFDFDLPDALIARYPLDKRSHSRLLRLCGTSGDLDESKFADLPNLLGHNDILIINDTKVKKARLIGRKKTGGKIEFLCVKIIASNKADGLLKSNSKVIIGSRVYFDSKVWADIVCVNDDIFQLEFNCDVKDVLNDLGKIPIPPYFKRNVEEVDEKRYQTIYARHLGSLAAPTAGLHFDNDLMEKLKDKGITIGYITLHVGLGTFKPVKTININNHQMHSESFFIPQETLELIRRCKRLGGKVVCVGTTTLRALESFAGQRNLEKLEGETALFITPGYRFKIADILITNFHLPRSTLLMLVSAFGGIENVRNAYHFAINQNYRFYSYGDAMLINRNI